MQILGRFTLTAEAIEVEGDDGEEEVGGLACPHFHFLPHCRPHHQVGKR